jgi:hypothetical protein
MTEESRLSPLDYMLGVLCDETSTPERRADMAKAVAPYVHPLVRAVIKMQADRAIKK